MPLVPHCALPQFSTSSLILIRELIDTDGSVLSLSHATNSPTSTFSSLLGDMPCRLLQTCCRSSFPRMIFKSLDVTLISMKTLMLIEIRLPSSMICKRLAFLPPLSQNETPPSSLLKLINYKVSQCNSFILGLTCWKKHKSHHQVNGDSVSCFTSAHHSPVQRKRFCVTTTAGRRLGMTLSPAWSTRRLPNPRHQSCSTVLLTMSQRTQGPCTSAVCSKSVCNSDSLTTRSAATRRHNAPDA